MRILSRHERILARHYLQEISERAKSVRSAVDVNGKLVITDEIWITQWESLKDNLDKFTKDVREDKTGTGVLPGFPWTEKD